MSQQNPASINSLPEEVLEKILLQLRAPKRPQFWLLRGVNQRWLSRVRRHSNFRAEVQSHNLRMVERDGETAYLFHLAETTDGWKTDSEFLSDACFVDSTFFGHINECNMQLMRDSAFVLTSEVVKSFDILTGRLCLHDTNIPVTLEVALNHSQLKGNEKERSYGHWQRKLPAPEHNFPPVSLSFYAILPEAESIAWGESFTVTESVLFFERMASLGALQPLTSLSLLALDGEVIATKPFAFGLTSLARLESVYSFHKPYQRTRFYNMLPEIFRSDVLKTLSIAVLGLEDISQLANRFPRLEDLTIYGREIKPDFDYSPLTAFASLKRFGLCVTFGRMTPWYQCCHGTAHLHSVSLPSMTSLVLCTPYMCQHGLTTTLELASTVVELELGGMRWLYDLRTTLSHFLPAHSFPRLQQLEFNLPYANDNALNDVDNLVEILGANQESFPALRRLKIAVGKWAMSSCARRDFGLFENLPLQLKSIELINVFYPNACTELGYIPGSGMEWLRLLIDRFLDTQLDKAEISLRRNPKVLRRFRAEFSDRFAERPDQFGFERFESGWRFLGGGKWEMSRDFGEPNAESTLLDIDNQTRLLKFRLVSGENDKMVKWLDIAP